MSKTHLLCVAVFLLVGAFFTATQPITPEMAVISSVTVILFAIPSYRAVLTVHGVRRGFFLLLTLGLYALIIESSAINTGFPYGNFIYTDVLGTKLFGLTPWTVAFAYPPILLASYWLIRSTKMTKPLSIVILTSVTAMVIDLVLDPAAVALGFWYWHTPGFYYGVPLINFLGWLFSGIIGAGILHYLWKKNTKLPAAIAYSGMAIICFWSLVNIFLTQWIPALIGVSLAVLFINRIKYKRVQ